MRRSAPTLYANKAARDAKVEALVLSEQVSALYGGTIAAGLMLPPLGTAFAALFWRVVDHRPLLVWYVIVALLLPAANSFLYRYYKRHHVIPDDTRRWLTLQQWRFFLLTGGVGSMGVVLFVPHSMIHTLITFSCLFALASLIAPRVAQHSSLYLIAFPMLLFPFIVRAAIEPEVTTKLLAILSLIGLAYSMVMTKKLSTLIRESLVHRFNNEILVEELQVQTRTAETAQNEAEDANRAKSRFLAAASHDLRQPMHALSLFVSAAKEAPDEARRLALLDRIEASANAMEGLFNALLDISRLDAAVLKPDIHDFALAPMLDRLYIEYSPIARNKGIELRVRVPTEIVRSDIALIERVVRNFITNAIRHTDRGGVLLGCRSRRDSVLIEVYDTGCGIPDDKLDDVFREFYQLHNPERDRRKGLGLGLAIVKRVGELLYHPITVRSIVGRGSKFSIEVPRGDLVASEQQPSIQSNRNFDPLVGAFVVLIDDEADVREAVSILLKQWGCDVLTAGSGKEATAELKHRSQPPTVICADYRLRDGETGVDAIMSIQELYSRTPAILITGDTAPERLIEATSSSFELLHKPLRADRLREVLLKYVSL